MPYRKNEGTRRRYGLKPRVLVYDTSMGDCSIKMDDKIRESPDDYWAFQLGPGRWYADSWDLYLNEKADRATAVRAGPPSTDGIYIAGLRLDKLPLWGKLLRKTGVLSNGYIIKPQVYRAAGAS